MSQFKAVGSRSVSALLRKLAAAGRRATCVVYTFFLSWAAEVACEHRVPSELYWIQPTTVLAMYFRGFAGVIAANAHDPYFVFPGELARSATDPYSGLPSILTSSPDDLFYAVLRELFATLDGETTPSSKPAVLMDTFDTADPGAIASVSEKLDVITVGPLMPSWAIDGEEGAENAASSGDLIKPDIETAYMRWLDMKPNKSVVYVSFESYLKMLLWQLKEMLQGPNECGRPHLWEVRKDNRGETADLEAVGERVRVLSHPAVGCFVTNCGWSSTEESLVCGVPTVGMPQWSDQKVNAALAEEVWGTGVRAAADKDGVVEAGELRRCLEVVMGEG